LIFPPCQIQNANRSLDTGKWICRLSGSSLTKQAKTFFVVFSPPEVSLTLKRKNRGTGYMEPTDQVRRISGSSLDTYFRFIL
jgi:hypothetical protein